MNAKNQSPHTQIIKKLRRKSEKTLHFTITSQNHIKYLGVTLIKKLKDLHDKNFKSLKKEIIEDTRK